MRQFQTALPTVLPQQLADRGSTSPVKVFAQDATRLGLLPVVRRRVTAYGGQPGATVTDQCDHFYLYGAVEPSTGGHFFLELPYLNSRAFQGWLNGFAAAFPASGNVLGLDNGAGHKAQAGRWPTNVVPVFLPPIVRNAIRLNGSGWDLKDKLAAIPAKIIDALSEAMGAIIQHYSHATLQSLTSFAYFVQAVEAVQKALYG